MKERDKEKKQLQPNDIYFCMALLIFTTMEVSLLLYSIAFTVANINYLF